MATERGRYPVLQGRQTIILLFLKCPILSFLRNSQFRYFLFRWGDLSEFASQRNPNLFETRLWRTASSNPDRDGDSLQHKVRMSTSEQRGQKDMAR